MSAAAALKYKKQIPKKHQESAPLGVKADKGTGGACGEHKEAKKGVLINSDTFPKCSPGYCCKELQEHLVT